MWKRVPKPAKARCGVTLLDHDVWANGSQWGTTRDGRGDVAAIVSETGLWDGCYWTTARKQEMETWSAHGCG